MIAMAAMMAGMMLPAAAPATLRRARTSVCAALLFIASYLAIWALIGAAIGTFYRPPGVLVAGLITIAAGIYELTPLKRALRLRCNEHVSGLRFGCACVASCSGLMAMQTVLGMMDLTWMALIAAIIVAQKVLPPMRAVDVSLGFAIVALGALIAFAPDAIPSITQP
ncbi:MAG TPA: DUF2182 domain-containing protein, partial [Verrucomicrobiae bacterium]|nr:DUF2182 domain-containing protein [Verrucomicrobiae bacterium]